MNLTSQQQGKFPNKAGKLWQLLGAALLTWQAAVPVALLLTSSTLLTANVAYAVNTSQVTIIQGFGWDYSGGGYKTQTRTRCKSASISIISENSGI